MKSLNNINKKNPFKVPKSYFENFNRELKTKISEEYLKKNIGNENPFTLPENYFENFSPEVLQNKKREKGKVIKLLKPWFSAAAGIIVIFALWQFLLTNIDSYKANNENISKTENSQNLAEINNDDLQYLEPEIDAYINEVDISNIYEYANDENDKSLTDTDDEAAYEYFIDYTDDYEYTEIIAEL